MFSRHGWYASEGHQDRHVFALYVEDKYIGLYNNQMPPGETFNKKKYLWPDLPPANNFVDIDLSDEKLVQSLFSFTNNAWLLEDRIFRSTGYFIHYSIYRLNEQEQKDTRERYCIPYKYQVIYIDNPSQNYELEIF